LILDCHSKKDYTKKYKTFRKNTVSLCRHASKEYIVMKYQYSQAELQFSAAANENTFLLCNGLGGYCSVSAGFSAPRADQGILVAAIKAPNERITMVHHLEETLTAGGRCTRLSSQAYANGDNMEDGLSHLRAFSMEYAPCWEYDIPGVQVRRQCAIAREANTAAVLYEITNSTDQVCTLQVTPLFKFAPKEMALEEKKTLCRGDHAVSCDGYTVYIHTDGQLTETAPAWPLLSYTEDVKDGRPACGYSASCCQISFQAMPGSSRFEIVFSTNETASSGWQLLQMQTAYLRGLEEGCHFEDPIARQLVLAADAYISHRDATNEKTILAGYPLFSDWGRDTMIALPGCTLATGRYEDAKSILRTFLAYEKDGLVPNLFPEGGCAPMYNTVDAALLLIDSVWQYLRCTNDLDFVREAWPVMERIVAFYQKGTHHAIGMDDDGLIFAGQGLDQVTWMDVCVQGILPTPRHGKPVEINAYWYNALMIMDAMAKELALDAKDYAALAQTVKKSFLEKFYIPEKGYLKDVLSDTEADEQIRCNQIWALSMSFTMLPADWEKSVLATVEKHLYTPWGLRTLSPEDKQYHGYYGGAQFDRDMAYHQGTTWVFPMGAFYRAKLKIEGDTRAVEEGLANLQTMMTQGCAGQLPEIYDGDHPYEGKGCFGQAWSVGEMLRVFEVLEKENN
jgi:predicted glycogen debranching enzyme